MENNRRVRGEGLVLWLLVILVVLWPTMGVAIPQKINYQGYLTNAAGVPINATIQMTFSLYDVSTGGGSSWTETQSVPVINGIYNVVLGDVTPIPLPFNVQYYLGIKVGTDPEMTPRKPLTSVGYAFRAMTADIVGAHTHSGADVTSGIVSEPRIDSAIARTSALSAHTSNTSNPHSTTAVQVGAAALLHAHSGGDITTGTVPESRIDPLIARDTEVTSVIGTHTSNASAHHTRYTDTEAVAAIKAADGAGSGLDADLLDGQHASAFSTSGHSHDSAYVNVAGDTMTGTLNLPSNGLVAGTNQLVLSNGKVGIGTPSPSELLEVKSDASSAYIVLDRGPDQLGGIKHGEAGTTRWIFPFFRGWQSDNLIVRDEANLKDVMTYEAGSGKVGIGISTPQQKLDVDGQIRTKTGYGDYIRVGGDNVGDDVEISIAAPASRNIVSFWNEQIGAGANIGVAGVHFADGTRLTSYRGFPRPNFDSGWNAINPGQLFTLTHNVGVDVNKYFVDLQFKSDIWGITNVSFGGDSGRGGHYQELTTTSIAVRRSTDDVMLDNFRVRIWLYE